MGVAALVSACAVVLGACVGPGSSKWLFGSWDAVGTVEVPYLPIAQAVGPADGGGILIGGLASSTYQAKAVRVSPAGDVVYDVPLGLGAVNRTVSDARGDLFIGSTTDTRNDVRPALWRFSPSGAPDDSFGAAGVVSFDPPPPQLPPNPYIAELTDFLRASAIAAAVDDSGRTYVLVSSLRGRTWIHPILELFVGRLLPNGSPDPSWGVDGFVDIGSHILEYGDPTPAGTLTFVDDTHLVLAVPQWAHASVGALDVTAPGPVTLTDVFMSAVSGCPGYTKNAVTFAGATESGGRAIISVTGNGGGCPLPSVLSVGPDGRLDPTFGTNGRLTWPTEYDNYVTSGAMSAIGTVFQVGDHLAVPGNRWMSQTTVESGLVEFHTDGTLLHPELRDGFRRLDLGPANPRHVLAANGTGFTNTVGSASSDAEYLAGITFDDPYGLANGRVVVTKLTPSALGG